MEVLPLLPLVLVSVLAVPLPVVPLPDAVLPEPVVLPDAVLPEPVVPELEPLALGVVVEEPALEPVLPEPVVLEPAAPPVLGVVADDPLEVPEPAVPLPEVWAIESPPIARAAAAARVVRVFLVVVMSYSLSEETPKGNRLKKAGPKPADSDYFWISGIKVGFCRHSL
jgi:hypothetical protein